MSDVLLGILTACAIGVLIEGYVLIGRVLLFQDNSEQTLALQRHLLGLQPGKSAPPTDGSSEQPWPKFAKLRAGADWVNARMQPTFLEPEQPATEPHRVVRPSLVPRDPMPVTEPMELADEMAADAHAYVAREGVLSDEEWQAKQEAEWAAIKADIAKMAKGVAT